MSSQDDGTEATVTFHEDDATHWACGRAMGAYRGTFPNGFLNRLNDRFGIYHYETLFPFGGATPTRDNWLINDIRKGEPTGPDDEPLPADTGYDATKLPDGTDDVTDWTNQFPVVVSDPPYAEHYAADLYGTEYPRPSAHFAEATRVCEPGGYVLVLDQLVYNLDWAHENHPVERVDVLGVSPHPEPNENVVSVTTGPGMRIRALNVFRKPETLEGFQ